MLRRTTMLRQMMVALSLLLISGAGDGALHAAAAQPGPPQRGSVERAYFEVRNAQGRAAVAGSTRHTFPNDVVSVEASPQAIANLQRNPNLQFRGMVSIWELQGRPVGRPGGGTATCSPSTDVTANGGRGWDVRLCNAGQQGAGAGRVVAVLDTGVTTTHPDFRAVAAGPKFVACKDATGNGVANGCADRDGHGTHVAGTIAANGRIRGVAPDAQLMAIKVCGAWCWGDDVARAIRWAADNGANVISMSLSGGSITQDERLAIDYATAPGKDLLVVAAAGNSGPNLGTIGYPAAYEKVVSAAATDKRAETQPHRIADYSSRGDNDERNLHADPSRDPREVELSAPGSNVESTYKDGCYYVYSGTSMATPHVSGLGAVLWQQNSGAATRTYLRSLGADVGEGIWAGFGNDAASGFGFLRAP